jgi:Putative peptidoglycan binding domain
MLGNFTPFQQSKRGLILAACLSIGAGSLSAQRNNLDYLVNNVVEGKAYVLTKSKTKNDHTIEEKEGYYIKIVPPKYKTVFDTVVISPELNGNLDTTNYFIQTEIFVLREPSAVWKTATVSKVCTTEYGSNLEPNHVALCLLKTVPKYEMVHRKFYPFKNILDVSTTDNVVPAEIRIIERFELTDAARLEHIPFSEKEPRLSDGEKLIKINPGTWNHWAEAVCPFGIFNDPDIKQIQAALQKQGYKINLSNSYDEQTKQAVHAFQLDHMLPQGELDDETLKRMGIEKQKLIQIQD